MNQLRIKCPAKINLALDVVSKRGDGYHNVDMIMQSIPLYDYVEISKAPTGAIRIETNNPSLCAGRNNIAFRAAELFLDKAKIDCGINIYIEKNIPTGAGLAGGSADAAGVLVALNQMFGAEYTQSELMEVGLSLGADVPFCVAGVMSENGGVTARATGIGEKLEMIHSGLDVRYVLVNPGFEVSTAWVYQNLKLGGIKSRPDIIKVIEGITRGDIQKTAENTANVLEDVTISEYPELLKYKSIFLECGAAFSLMSGSGPTVFGVFENDADAKEAYDRIKDTADFSAILGKEGMFK